MKTLFLLPLICIFIISCERKQTEIFSSDGWYTRDQRPNEDLRLGTITKVATYMIAVLPSGEQMLVKDTSDHRVPPSSAYASIKLTDSSELELDIPIKTFALVSLDRDGDKFADTTIRYSYIGQKVGDKIDIFCGNPVNLASK